ncbi:Neuronal acetylcholine receptor subunit alpha-4 [Fasciola gigantica]|uniref:Neuronal acetylcholine receptor subunit alpha-4 n=1 Tax=Fasciola gigantica TaxID=46835 RepID=A0A504YWH1_FASGI|nr:Neuronal acetylcholine receptor subunit alpha-4 [Fasciola gigantica]
MYHFPTWWPVFMIALATLDISEQIAPKGHPKETKTYSVEKTLIRMLLNRYEQFGVIGRPVNDSKIQVTVRYGLQLFQILDLDENKQILRTNCWSMYAWNDSLLRWNSSEYGDIMTVRIFPSQIWTPDIKLYNFADERLKEHREARVVIDNNGGALWVPQALFKSTCEVEITYFPFDTQICMLEFGSWTYDKTQLDITWWLPDADPMPYLDFSDYVPSNEWRTDGEKEREVHHTNRTLQIRSVKKYRRRNQTVGNQVITRDFPVLRYLVRLRRNPSFYVFMLVIPCVLLSSLTLVVFWLPPESPAKMMLGMNIFVAFFVLLILLAESTPSAVKNFPLIGVYFCLNMIMITLSTFLATLVIHLYFRGDRNGVVPRILRRIIIEGIGRLLLVRQRIPLPDVKKNPTHSSPRTTSSLPHRREMSGSNFLMNESSFGEDSRTSFHVGNAHGPAPAPAPLGLMPGAGYPMFGDQIPYDMRAAGPGGPMPGPYGSASGMVPKFPPGAGFFEPCNCGAATARDGPVGNLTGTPAMEKDAFGFPAMKDQRENGTPDQDEQAPEWMNSTATLERDVREVKRYVKAFVSRQKEIQRKSFVAMEWRTLALVLDRLFFFLYITTIAVAVIVSVPRSTEPEVPEAFRETETQ